MPEQSRIHSLSIESFRGLRNLRLEGLSGVNLILGTSNIGKTSILEAICMLRSKSPSNIIKTVSERFTDYPSLESIHYLFPVGESNFSLSSSTSAGNIHLSCSYKMGQIPRILPTGGTLFDFYPDDVGEKSDLEQKGSNKGKKVMVPIIEGKMTFNNEVTSFSWLDGRYHVDEKKTSVDVLKINYLSPFDHFANFDNLISHLLESKEHKDLFIHILKLFDPKIDDVLYLKRSGPTFPELNSFTLFVRLENGSQMPMSVYGDGLKKVSLLASALVYASNGILLIDEIETSLHHSYYDEVFSFIVRAAEHFNVQLFITSHNEEAIRRFLDADSNYSDGNANVFTLKSDDAGNVIYRCLKGKEALERMEKERLEVRS